MLKFCVQNLCPFFMYLWTSIRDNFDISEDNVKKMSNTER